ncbi:MAG TPA: sialidase family protein [Candidatus Polarisedimenticolia bacterium]|nr:sialidase family protein [Candidatus Polarisedimenticolia bacterium]
MFTSEPRDSVRLSLLAGVLLLAAVTMAGAAPKSVVFGADQEVGGEGTSQANPSIAFNPVDSSELVVAFVDTYSAGSIPAAACRTAFRTVAGWQTGDAVPLELPAGATSVTCGFPAIAGDESGSFYVAYLKGISAPGRFDSEVFVAKSTDGGESFSSSSMIFDGVSGRADTPSIAVDNWAGSPFRGRVYVAYTNFGFGTTESMQAAFSRDGGATWSAPQDISVPVDKETPVGANVVVAPNGSVFVFWSSFLHSSSKKLSILFTRSDDGGITWVREDSVASHLPSPGFFRLKNEDPLFMVSPFAGIAANSNPSAAVGPDGTLYLAWTDFKEGSCKSLSSFGDFACANADVRLSLSKNGGKSWSKPVKVSDESPAGSDQFHPQIAVHPDGLVSLVWLDRRLDPDNVDVNTFYTNTSDGVSFLANVRVSGATSTVGSSASLGDRIGLAVAGSEVDPVWGDLRTGTLGLFTAKGSLAP